MQVGADKYITRCHKSKSSKIPRKINYIKLWILKKLLTQKITSARCYFPKLKMKKPIERISQRNVSFLNQVLIRSLSRVTNTLRILVYVGSIANKYNNIYYHHQHREVTSCIVCETYLCRGFVVAASETLRLRYIIAFLQQAHRQNDNSARRQYFSAAGCLHSCLIPLLIFFEVGKMK